jgi:mRNA-degrading endonuclease toxin of MazEF toxin-antitoxin module
MSLNKNEIYLGHTYIVDLPKNNGYCLSGLHHCVVIKRIGSTAIVVPISTNRNNIHYGEIAIENETNFITDKKYKLKVGQITSVSTDKIIRYIRQENKENIRNIENFIQKEIVDFMHDHVA